MDADPRLVIVWSSAQPNSNRRQHDWCTGTWWRGGVLDNRAYTCNDRNPEAERKPDETVWAMLFKHKKGKVLPTENTQSWIACRSHYWRRWSPRSISTNDNLVIPKPVIEGYFRTHNNFTCCFLWLISIMFVRCWSHEQNNFVQHSEKPGLICSDC